MEVVNKYASKIKLQQDTKVGAEDDFESFSVENVCSDVISSLDALEQYEVDISAVRDDIIKASYDAVLLYSGNSDIQLDPVAAAIETVFVKLKALMLPIVFALFDDVPEMIAALKDHGKRAQEFKEALENSNLNIDFGEHSEYMHLLTTLNHAEQDCRWLLETYGAHLSEVNCETNEHVNKVLKGILVRLQGFANRPVGNHGTSEDNKILNHFGFVLQE